MTKKDIAEIQKQLISWKNSLKRDYDDITVKPCVEEPNTEEGDIVDNSNIIYLNHKKKDLHKKTLKDIEAALKKIQNNTYGICEESGERIDLKRLKANPIARYSLEAQLAMEHFKKINKC